MAEHWAASKDVKMVETKGPWMVVLKVAWKVESLVASTVLMKVVPMAV